MPVPSRFLLSLTLASTLALMLSTASLQAQKSATAGWPNWRGPALTGVAPTSDPPVRWSESENVRWKVPIPGRGLASPVVYGDQIFLLTARIAGKADEPAAAAGRGVAPDHVLNFDVLTLSRQDGSVLWQQTATSEQPHEGTHTDASWASASPATDGERLYAFFGSRGLFVYDLDGEVLWQRQFGQMSTRNGFGEGSSPALSSSLVLINWDHEGDSFLVAIDKVTGKDVWRVDRDEVTSWSTPLILENADPPQVVVAATGSTRGYALDSGKILWQVPGMTVNVVPTPTYGDGHVYVASGFRGAAMQAIRLAGARGDLIESESLSWSRSADTPYVPTPLLYRGQLYFFKVNTGILTSVDAATGEVILGPERLPGISGVYASPIAADGRIYVFGRNGSTSVLRHGDKLEVLATNELDDRFDASPAVVDDALVLRGHQHLYYIEASTTPPAPALDR